MATVFHNLTQAGISTRAASALAGVSRATMARHKRVKLHPRTPQDASAPTPVNKLSAEEETRILQVLNSDRFVDQAPEQVYAVLLSEGTYLGSVSTMYRLLRREKQVLERRAQVLERRAQARHPARKVPELVAY